jgi:hypothetical protein
VVGDGPPLDVGAALDVGRHQRDRDRPVAVGHQLLGHRRQRAQVRPEHLDEPGGGLLVDLAAVPPHLAHHEVEHVLGALDRLAALLVHPGPA